MSKGREGLLFNMGRKKTEKEVINCWTEPRFNMSLIDLDTE